MAVNEDIIFIQISLVSREYSRSQTMDLYAAKGSGAIENASRKVLGITGKSDDPELQKGHSKFIENETERRRNKFN